MKLEFQSVYKSIKSLKLFELPNFTILTGVNGSGKTQLLEAITASAISIDGITPQRNQAIFRLFNWNSLIPNNSESINAYQLTQERTDYWTTLQQPINKYRDQLINQFRRFLNEKGYVEILGHDASKVISMSREELIESTDNTTLVNEILNWIQTHKPGHDSSIDSIFSQNGTQHKQLIDLLRKKTSKSIIDFNEDDFYETYIMTTLPVDIFQQSFSRLFTAYEKMRVDNKFNKYLHEQEGEAIGFLTDEDFVKRYGDPPWEFLNSVLESSNLDFRITKPTRIREAVPYQAKLIHQRSGDELVFSDLSSGEKILMSFALCLYYAEDKRQIVQYPQVLLFDEIDAPLHPSMTQSLLNTIESTLVEKHGIKVIMTTHSPSTVALAPESSLYVMEKDGYDRVRKISKDSALALLTTGVPTLSIDYENRRQVFVESKHDVGYYEKIYNACRQYLEPAISLTFIASGFGDQGNCDQVAHIVGGLVQGGNRNAYGVIDWDTKNEGSEQVRVLGKGKRYSIENYLLEPIFIALLLWKDTKIDSSDLGLSSQETYRTIKIDNANLQLMANYVIIKFLEKYPIGQDARVTHCKYIGKYLTEVPDWYLKCQGHELEKKLKETFHSLNQYNNEPALKKAILEKVLVDFPELLPVDFIELFKEIQNYNNQT